MLTGSATQVRTLREAKDRNNIARMMQTLENNPDRLRYAREMYNATNRQGGISAKAHRKLWNTIIGRRV